MGAEEIARFLPGLVRRDTSEEAAAEVAAGAVEETGEASGTSKEEPTGETTAVIEVGGSCFNKDMTLRSVC